MSALEDIDIGEYSSKSTQDQGRTHWNGIWNFDLSSRI